MDLIERYLAAIGRELPAGQAPDVVAELRDVLLSQVEEAEERLGRALTAREVERLLTDFGHPLVVAGRYRKVQHLVGPGIFPFWWAALKASLTIAGAVLLVLFAVRWVTDGDSALIASVFPSLWSTGLSVFAIVTLVAVGFEQAGAARLLTQWRPAGLPPADVMPRSRFDLVVEIGMGVAFVLWWIGAFHFRNFIPERAHLVVSMAPVWTAFYWPILAYALADIGVNLLALTRQGWGRALSVLSISRYLAAAAILLAVLQADSWVVISGDRPAEELAALQANLDFALRIGLIAVTAVFTIKAAAELWRLLRRADAHSPRLCGFSLRL